MRVSFSFERNDLQLSIDQEKHVAKSDCVQQQEDGQIIFHIFFNKTTFLLNPINYLQLTKRYIVCLAQKVAEENGEKRKVYWWR